MSERILIVDDEDIIRESLARMLGLGGYEVGHTSSGEEGLRRLAERPYALLLIDLRMPEMSGLQFLEAARQVEPDCGALIITGYGTLEGAIAAMELGAHGFILKPVTADVLLSKASAILSRLRSSREHQRLSALRSVSYLSQALLGTEQPQRMMELLLDHGMREMGAHQGVALLEEGQEMQVVATGGSPRVHRRW